jgi:uncharacterized membrane protein
VSAGLITILPIMVTIWLVWIVFGWFRGLFSWIIGLAMKGPWGPKLAATWGVDPAQWRALGLQALPTHLQWVVAAFAILLTFLLLYLIGLFTANVIGRRILEWFDYLIGRVPFIKSVYGALKQIVGIFSGQQTQGYQRVALVPFPNELTRSIAFITNTFRDPRTGEELCTAFIASTPNPTTGFVFVIRRSDIIEVDWSVEEAFKAIMSGGTLIPTTATMGATKTPSSASSRTATASRPAPPGGDA